MLLVVFFTPVTIYAPEVHANVTPLVYKHPVYIEQETKDTITTTGSAEDESCNCWLYVKNRIDTVATMNSIVANASATPGAVAIETFNGVKHVSIVTDVTNQGVHVKESNYVHCTSGTRFISFESERLIGFASF